MLKVDLSKKKKTGKGRENTVKNIKGFEKTKLKRLSNTKGSGSLEKVLTGKGWYCKVESTETRNVLSKKESNFKRGTAPKRKEVE